VLQRWSAQHLRSLFVSLGAVECNISPLGEAATLMPPQKHLNTLGLFFNLVLCTFIFGSVCAYFLVNMRAFQLLAIGSAVLPAAALTPELVPIV